MTIGESRQAGGARKADGSVSAGGAVLDGLERVIASRRGASADRSYTARLLAGGAAACGAKVTEEAAELVAAAAGEPAERVVAEAADLVYHMLVLLATRDVPLSAVEGELARRFGVSGLEEKAARTAGRPGAAAEGTA